MPNLDLLRLRLTIFERRLVEVTPPKTGMEEREEMVLRRDIERLKREIGEGS